LLEETHCFRQRTRVISGIPGTPIPPPELTAELPASALLFSLRFSGAAVGPLASTGSTGEFSSEAVPAPSRYAAPARAGIRTMKVRAKKPKTTSIRPAGVTVCLLALRIGAPRIGDTIHEF
jgi:hypothetical protein